MGTTGKIIVFNISMIYRLDGDDMIVEIPYDEIQYREEYPIYYLTVLPYFGAGGMQEDGFLLVPEGGGSVMLRLLDADGRQVAEAALAGRGGYRAARMEVTAPRKWTAETPYLYTLMATVLSGGLS